MLASKLASCTRAFIELKYKASSVIHSVYLFQVRRTFNVGFDRIHQDFRYLKYAWLPSEDVLVKPLGEKVPMEQLEKLEVRPFFIINISGL